MRRGQAVRKILHNSLLALIGCAPLPAMALLDTCTVATLPVSFGSYNALSGSALTSTGTVSLTCTGITLLGLTSINVDYTINLSTGGAGSYSPRKMSLLSNRLNYNLFRDVAYAQIWGDGTGGSFTVTGGIHQSGLLVSSVTVNIPVYGRIPASQNIPAGAYNDVITVTVNY
jgi:spore coat protein U-like protein